MNVLCNEKGVSSPHFLLSQFVDVRFNPFLSSVLELSPRGTGDASGGIVPCVPTFCLTFLCAYGKTLILNTVQPRTSGYLLSLIAVRSAGYYFIAVCRSLDMLAIK